MLPEPLHPAVVHLPIALSVVTPLLAVGLLVGPRSMRSRRPLWIVVVILHAVLLASSWAAFETGEAQEEIVEAVVGDGIIEKHEQAANVFLALALTAFVASLTGTRAGRIGAVSRSFAAAAGLAMLVAGVNVGHAGGELVYRHGAAAVYADNAPAKRSAPSHAGDEGARHESDDD